jgi:hypothetical protein
MERSAGIFDSELWLAHRTLPLPSTQRIGQRAGPNEINDVPRANSLVSDRLSLKPRLHKLTGPRQTGKSGPV